MLALAKFRSAHPTIDQVREVKAKEKRAIKTGKWGEWRRIELPNGGPGGGWNREIRWAMANDLYAVLCRPLRTSDGEVIHCAIRTISGFEPPWRDKQRIKNELFGPERVATEVMPAMSKLVDEADMYHMWVMPECYISECCLKCEPLWGDQ
jgi:hypothetical protein